MANLSASNVTVIDSWRGGATNGKRNKFRRVKWTSTTAGSVANQLLASSFGFTKIYNCSAIVLNATTPLLFPAAPSADGTYIMVADPAQATDADRGKGADIATSTDYAYITLEGV